MEILAIKVQHRAGNTSYLQVDIRLRNSINPLNLGRLEFCYYKPLQLYIHRPIFKNALASILTRPQTHAYRYTRANRAIRRYTHARIHTHTYANTRKHTHTRSQTHTQTHTHTHTHTYKPTHTHTRTRTCVHTPTQTLTQYSFAFEGPIFWNHLPDNVKEAESIELFKQILKTLEFSQSFEIPAFLICNSVLYDI